ncbi:trypsin-like peptidase domain-containing protein [Kitasatospora sp. NPDC004669]|uniref:serine protease n=1 Tax=Kitasatospora sp. NPDC004669 TaxID=3154555 RepID=UPI0033A4FAD8
MESSRVVEIRNAAREESGSGFLIADDLVLTAYHVAQPAAAGRSDLRVRRLRDGEDSAMFEAALLWPRGPVDIKANPSSDVALLRITDPAWAAPGFAPALLGRFPDARSRCSFLGFPRKNATRRYRDSGMVRDAPVEPLDSVRGGRFWIEVPDDGTARPDVSPWAGASGAAVWSGGLLVGVLTADKPVLLRQQPRPTRNLVAVRLEPLLKQRHFADALVAHGITPQAPEADQKLDPVDFYDDLAATRPDTPDTVATSALARLRGTALLAAVGFAVALALVVRQLASGASGTSPASVAAVAGLALSLVLLLKSTAAPSKRTDRDLTRAAAKLRSAFAGDVMARRQRLLGGAGRQSDAIDVSFRLAATSRLTPVGAASGGSFDTVADYFRSLAPPRLVITGPPGSGKTLLALELAHRLLADEPGQRLAFMVGIARWDPSVPFVDWMCEAVAEDYDGIDPALVRGLLLQGRLVPVLDGLDEMDIAAAGRERARKALGALADHPGPLVLACREDASTELEADGAWLPAAATVALETVGAAAAWEYLAAQEADLGLLEETGVRAGLGDPGSVFATVLNTPWMLSLTAAVSRSRSGAAALRAFAGRAPTESAGRAGTQRLRALLLDQLIPAKVETHTRRAYTEKSVNRWLSAIAHFLLTEGVPTQPGQERSRRDILPHRLWPICGDRAPRITAATLTLACWIPLYACLVLGLRANGYLPQPGVEMLALLTLLPAMSARSVSGRWVQPRDMELRRLRSALGVERLGYGLLFGGTAGLVTSLYVGPAFGLAFGGGFVFVFGLGLAISVRRDVDRPTLRWTGLASAFATAALAATIGHRFGVIGGWGGGAVALILAVTRAIAARQRDGADPGGLPDPDLSGVPTPATAVRRDFRAGLIAGSMVAGLALYTTLTQPWFAVPLPLALATTASSGLAAGPGFVAEVSRVYAGMLLVARGRLLPWHLMAFLDWAQCEDLLRTTARAYQFRHDELLERLGTRAPDDFGAR